jgi:hypothetical protein
MAEAQRFVPLSRWYGSMDGDLVRQRDAGDKRRDRGSDRLTRRNDDLHGQCGQ